MAHDINKVPIGMATFFIGDYVAAGAAGSLTEVGLTQGGIEVSDTDEDFELDADQYHGVLRSKPFKTAVTVKIPMLEHDLDKLRRIIRQASGNLTGVSPNKVLARDQAQEQYMQGQLIGVAIAGAAGTFGVRTQTFWKLALAAREPWPHKKDGAQIVIATFKACQDLTITAGNGKGQWYNITDTGGA